MEYLLGVDIGTSGCKIVIIDLNGNIIYNDQEYYQVYSPYPMWYEHDPEEWYAAFKRTLLRAVKNSDIRLSDILAVGVDGMMNTPTFLDRSGNVIRKSILWMDQRSISQTKILSEKRLDQIFGLPASPVLLVTKLLWMIENESEVWKNTYKVILPKDYIVFKLTNNLVTDVSDASATMLYDNRIRKWSHDVCEELGLDVEKLPDVVDSTKVVGYISHQASLETGLRSGIPVIAGCSDGAADTLSAGVINTYDSLVRLGTTGAIFMPANKFLPDPELKYYVIAHCVPGLWLIHNIFPFGIPHKWFFNTFYSSLGKGDKVLSYDNIEIEASSVEMGSNGLIFLPYLDSEIGFKGGFFGIKTTHTRAHFARAVLEGIAFALKDTFTPFFKVTEKLEDIKLVGGGAKSKLLSQIICDVICLPVKIPAFQAACLGAAILCGVGTKLFRSFEDSVKKCVKISHTFEPTLSACKRYEEIFKQFIKVRENLEK
ncbi:MAG: FGGY family carbohydrate kinase [Nitrososphaeria archaeon]